MKIAKKVSQYVRNGKPVFVYTIEGTDEELQQYADDKGDWHRTDDSGNSLYFSTTPVVSGTNIIHTEKGNYVVETDLEERATALADAKTKFLGKLEVLAQATGTSSAVLAQRIVASMAGE